MNRPIVVTTEFPPEDFEKLSARARSERMTPETLIALAMRGLVSQRAVKNRRPRRRNDYQGGGLTAAQARKQRKQLKGEIDREHKRAALERLAGLRGQIAAAKQKAKPLREEAIWLCRIGRNMAKERAKQLRIEGRAAIRAAIEEEKKAAREACDARKAQVRTDVKSEVARARAELAEERKFQREIKRIESTNRKRERERPRASASERKQESDDAVRSNLPADLVPLFERVKRQIKATDRQSRTEAFLRYAEEHEGEVLQAIEENAEREIARLQREQAKEVRALRRRGFTSAELAAVPF